MGTQRFWSRNFILYFLGGLISEFFSLFLKPAKKGAKSLAGALKRINHESDLAPFFLDLSQMKNLLFSRDL